MICPIVTVQVSDPKNHPGEFGGPPTELDRRVHPTKQNPINRNPDWSATPAVVSDPCETLGEFVWSRALRRTAGGRRGPWISSDPKGCLQCVRLALMPHRARLAAHARRIGKVEARVTDPLWPTV